jgi:hypothetical protein
MGKYEILESLLIGKTFDKGNRLLIYSEVVRANIFRNGKR